MRRSPPRAAAWAFASAALAAASGACGEPVAGGADETTVMIASFGDGGPSDATATEGTSPTSATATSATTTSATTSATTDPTDPTDVATDVTNATTDASAEVTTDPTDPTDTPGGTSSGGEVPVCASIEATVRDFLGAHVDMLAPSTGAVEPGMVLGNLDDAGKPVFNPEYVGAVVTSADSFAQWYNDVPEINAPVGVALDVFEEAPGRTVFQSDAFFPIDAQGFGNENDAHNYFFTTEIRASIVYQGGERLTFGGDDDVWVFVDGRLAIDLGGKHSNATANLALDDLGLVPGESYSLDIFHAERGLSESHLRFELGAFCQL